MDCIHRGYIKLTLKRVQIKVISYMEDSKKPAELSCIF